jgi:hypothetical protein
MPLENKVIDVDIFLPCIELELKFNHKYHDLDVYFPAIVALFRTVKPSVKVLSRADSEAVLDGFSPTCHKIVIKIFEKLNPDIESLILTDTGG